MSARSTDHDDSLLFQLTLFAAVIALAAVVFAPSELGTIWKRIATVASSPPVLAIGLSVLVCGSFGFSVVWGISHGESRTISALAARSFPQQTQPTRATDSAAATLALRGAPNGFVEWPVFERALRLHKAIARDYCRPFTLLHMQIVAAADSRAKNAGIRSTAIRKLCFELLDGHLAPATIAAFSRNGGCFVLLPETTHDEAAVLAQSLTRAMQDRSDDQFQMEVRQYSYADARPAADRRVARRAVA